MLGQFPISYLTGTAGLFRQILNLNASSLSGGLQELFPLVEACNVSPLFLHRE